MPTFLHIGCGLKDKQRTTPVFSQECWQEVRVDINPSVTPDITASMTHMPAITTALADALFSSHNLEHLYAHEVPQALAEWQRVLKDDGYAIVVCPDLQSVCALVAQDALEEPVLQVRPAPITPLDILYGYRPALAAGDMFMAHRTGFTRKTLEAALMTAGFAGVVALRTLVPPYDIWALASKTKLPQEELQSLLYAHWG